MNSIGDKMTTGVSRSDEYRYTHANADHTQSYLWPVVEQFLLARKRDSKEQQRVFDLGCGNGAFMARLEELGFKATGVDPSESGVTQARLFRPVADIHVGSAYDQLASIYGQFPLVVSLEVVEHVYAPRDFAKTLYSLVKPGGTAIVSTPYHGYIKNLVLALTGKLDDHFGALWDHGHIKFWSVKTLTQLLTETGFVDIRFAFAGRCRHLAKSMVAIANRPMNSEPNP